jgi:hypothetical protein
MAIDKIALKTGHGIVQEEAVANAAITPGQLIERISTDKVRRHSTAGGSIGIKMIAVEDVLQGNGIDDDYAAADRVFFHIPQPGQEYYMFLKDGENLVIGDKVESAGDGDVQKFVEDTWAENIGADSSANIASGTIYQNQIIGIAREALDLSDSSGADPASRRIRIQIGG